MAANLFPLIYKPGIKRDGTTFQSEYCTDGQWIRFQRGVVKKIGGMLGMDTFFPRGAVLPATVTNIPNISLVSSTAGPNFYAYVGTNIGNTSRVYKLVFNANFLVVTAPFLITANLGAKTEFMWQFETIIIGNVRTIVCFGANNSLNIAQNSAPNLFSGPIEAAVDTQLVAVAGINPLANGGIGYASPFLFIYGSNGYVAFSASNNPLDFAVDGAAATAAQVLTISKDKVIWGRTIRGGSNSPAVLFWTLSSVVRVINTGPTTGVGARPINFQADVISNSSSILSSRCVVEYDGLFFWPGTDRFFVYNGIVQEMVNPINLNYFYNNIDMNHRQKVFGVKNTKYGEIWWFYPEKGQLGIVRNTRALIYNKRENSWYDTAISRDCGVFFDDLGSMYTFGRALENPDGREYLWRHEVNTNQEWYPNFLGGERTFTPINSRFTTPTFSWAAFNPLKQPTGVDRWVDFRRIEPDFIMDNNLDEMRLIVNTKEYAQSPNVVSAPFPFTRNTGRLDMNIQGRHMTLEFNSDKNFEMGHVMLLLGVGDGQ